MCSSSCDLPKLCVGSLHYGLLHVDVSFPLGLCEISRGNCVELAFPWRIPRGRRQAAPGATGGVGTIPGSGNGGQYRSSLHLHSLRSAPSLPSLPAGGHGILVNSRREELRATGGGSSDGTFL